MSIEETLQRAIVRLRVKEMSGWSYVEGTRQVLDGSGNLVADRVLPMDRHRFIDPTVGAQIAVLEAALFNVKEKFGYTHATVAATIRLAESIVGVES